MAIVEEARGMADGADVERAKDGGDGRSRCPYPDEIFFF
jgi:hypothetical protein